MNFLYFVHKKLSQRNSTATNGSTNRSIFIIILLPVLPAIALLSSLIPLQQLVYADDVSNGQDDGVRDADRDCQGLNGHGFDDSIHHGSPEYKSAYIQAYDDEWNKSCTSTESHSTSNEGTGSYDKG
jgi:hypothetical protein